MPLRELANSLQKRFPDEVIYSPRLFEVFDTLQESAIPHAILGQLLDPGTKAIRTNRGISLAVGDRSFSLSCSEKIAEAMILLTSYAGGSLPVLAAAGQAFALEIGVSGLEVVSSTPTRVFEQEIPSNFRLFPQAMTPIHYLELLFPKIPSVKVFSEQYIKLDQEKNEIRFNSPLSKKVIIMNQAHDLFGAMLKLLNSSMETPYQIGLEASDPVIYSTNLRVFKNAKTGAIVQPEQIEFNSTHSREDIIYTAGLISKFQKVRFLDENDLDSPIIIGKDLTIYHTDPAHRILSELFSATAEHLHIGTTGEASHVYYLPETGYMIGNFAELRRRKEQHLLHDNTNPLSDIPDGSTLVKSNRAGKARFFVLRPGTSEKGVEAESRNYYIYSQLIEGKTGIFETNEKFLFVSCSEGRIRYELLEKNDPRCKIDADDKRYFIIKPRPEPKEKQVKQVTTIQKGKRSRDNRGDQRSRRSR